MDILEIKNVTYNYSNSREKILLSVNQKFELGQFYAIIGKSGAGKSTLLSLLAGLDKPQKGQILFKNEDIENKGYSNHRKNNITLVFQNYNLIDHLNILENVELTLSLSNVPHKERKKLVLASLSKVGLQKHAHKKPSELSGGEKQRVAIARAIVNNPKIITLDEPTGALDSKTSIEIMDLIKEISTDKLVIMVTHNKELSQKYGNRVIELKDGKIIKDTNPYNNDDTEEKIKIIKIL